MCGSGRFLVPFMQKGFRMTGVDNSAEMLDKLKQKAPSASVALSDLETYRTEERYDYMFISSGSVSLFTDMQVCKAVLQNLKDLLKPGGIFVFAVDTIADRCPDDEAYRVNISVKTKENHDLVLKTKNCFDESTCTQFSPGIYELYDGNRLLQSEKMDFQTHLYKQGEMEAVLREIGFADVKVYSSFRKEPVVSDRAEMFLYECVNP